MNNNKSIFPNLSTVAYYDPKYQTITLENIKKAALDAALENMSYDYMQTLKVYIHEMSHWKDHHATLWGLRNLIKLFNALNSRINNDPHKFYHIPSYIKDTRLSIMTEYYHTVESEYDVFKNKKYWKWENSVGLRFTHDGYMNEDAPILFVNFKNPDDNTRISRTPIVVSSILETKAMAEELLSALYYLRKTSYNSIEIKIEEDVIKNEALRWLYNPNMTLYSAVAHLSSCLTLRGDIVEILQFARNLANIVLSLPDKYYDQMIVNPDFQAYKERTAKLVLNKDIGFAYKNLILNYRDSKFDKTEYNIDDLLVASKMPSLNVLHSEVIKEFNNLRQSVIGGPLHDIMQQKIDNAISYFSKYGFDLNNFNSLSFIDYETPRITFSDTKLEDDIIEKDIFLYKCWSRHHISDSDWIYNIDEIYDQVDTFNNICGV